MSATATLGPDPGDARARTGKDQGARERELREHVRTDPVQPMECAPKVGQSDF
jgi:hypothetical protein